MSSTIARPYVGPAVVDLGARRSAAEQAIAAFAAAPVRFVPTALLDVLEGLSADQALAGAPVWDSRPALALAR